MTMRLPRFLADALGISRRKAEELVEQGRVTVNGVPAVPGLPVDPAVDRVLVDGERVRRKEQRIYLMLHKPRETICSERDPEGRRSVHELLPSLPVRVHAIGRLDFLSEGLLLFTNDGNLTRELTRRSRGIERVYEVKVQGGLPPWALERLVRGVRLEDGMARALRAEVIHRPRVRSNVWVRVVLDEGRYREVRRMFQAMGFNVLKLRRVQFGPIRLGSLPPGAFRFLRDSEVERLLRAIEDPESLRPRPEAASGRRAGRRRPVVGGKAGARPNRRRGDRRATGSVGRGSSGPEGRFEALVERAVRQAASGRRPRSATGKSVPGLRSGQVPRKGAHPGDEEPRTPNRRGSGRPNPSRRLRSHRQKV